MLRHGRDERSQRLIDFFCECEYFCHIGIKHDHHRTILHAAGEAVRFGPFMIELVFGGHVRNFTGFVCGRFFHFYCNYCIYESGGVSLLLYHSGLLTLPSCNWRSSLAPPATIVPDTCAALRDRRSAGERSGVGGQV